MSWHAIVPYNYGRDCKTRLADRLSRAERDSLSLAMAAHVVRVLGDAPEVAAVYLLSPERPPIGGAQWIADGGHGLNAELAAARASLGEPPVIFVHADMPGLTADDIAALCGAAGPAGAAIAPDSADSGTNALAIAADAGLVPAFGRDSFARHRVLFPHAALVRRPGLSQDIDEPENLDAAIADGLIAKLLAGHRPADMR